jgi:hypothetical protein
MLLSNCKVVDGKGTEFQLVDGNGCSTDEYLFPQVTYSDDVTTVSQITQTVFTTLNLGNGRNSGFQFS